MCGHFWLLVLWSWSLDLPSIEIDLAHPLRNTSCLFRGWLSRGFITCHCLSHAPAVSISAFSPLTASFPWFHWPLGQAHANSSAGISSSSSLPHPSPPPFPPPSLSSPAPWLCYTLQKSSLIPSCWSWPPPPSSPLFLCLALPLPVCSPLSVHLTHRSQMGFSPDWGRAAAWVIVNCRPGGKLIGQLWMEDTDHPTCSTKSVSVFFCNQMLPFTVGTIVQIC